MAWLGPVSGCVGKASPRAAIQSADAGERIRGIWIAGETRDRSAVPLLVDRLEDEDEAVRFVAILALEKIEGERFGYDYASTAQGRAAAVTRWREHVRQRQKTGAPDSKPPQSTEKTPRTIKGEG